MENTWNPVPPAVRRHRLFATWLATWLARRRRAGHAPFDPSLFFLTLFLTCGGICMLFSASYAIGIAAHHSAFHYVWKQMVHAAIGLLLMVGTSMVDLKKLRQHSGIWLLVTLFLLLLVFTALGVKFGGARRWLNTWPFIFQPSELAKLTLVVFLAHILSCPRKSSDWRCEPLLHAGAAVALVVGLILPQPHMSVILLLAATSFTMCILSGIPRQLLALLACLLLLLGTVGWFVAEDYQRERVLSWIRVVISGKEDPKDADYQILQSVKAFKRGGVRGVGFCEGKQKLLYLPAAHNDFIFSVVGEELGLLGTLFTLGLYTFFIWRGFHIAYNASDQFCCLLAAGLTSMIALQALIHVGVATHALPTTGMSLPFVSYGGSALMMTLAMVGFILNVSRYPDLQTGNESYEPAHRGGRNGRSRLSGPRHRRSSGRG